VGEMPVTRSAEPHDGGRGAEVEPAGRVDVPGDAGLSAAVGWVGGYALTWATRWMLASIPNGFGNTWQNILEVGAFRIGGQYEEAVETFPFASTWANVGQWLRVPTSWAFLLLTLAVPAWLLFLVRRTGPWLWPALIAAPALLVPVWFEFLRNHSQIQAFFTYLSSASLSQSASSCWRPLTPCSTGLGQTVGRRPHGQPLASISKAANTRGHNNPSLRDHQASHRPTACPNVRRSVHPTRNQQ
jgi:hypothetical protein